MRGLLVSPFSSLWQDVLFPILSSTMANPSPIASYPGAPHSLPVELIEAVISYSDRKTLSSFSHTCRQLRPCCLRWMVVGIDFQEKEIEHRICRFRYFLRRHADLIPLVTVTMPPYVLNSSLLHLFRHLPRLTIGVHNIFFGMEACRLSRYLRFRTSIHTLELDGLHFTTRSEFYRVLLCFTNLAALTCNDLSVKSSDEDLISVGRVSPKQRLLRTTRQLATLKVSMYETTILWVLKST